MIAKLIVHADTCDAAIQKMEQALRSVEIEGVSTTIPIHTKVLADPRFRAGDYDTRLLEEIA
jgi:acetyl-CoA carboxylase biotin carboxylase subunit